ncbi:UNVERIFIED_CONTAM: AAA family ATPase [Campylobacter lari]|uniref:McrB family protein n=1 Tax=Campylobacter lari TaxID=201 RepID=UPI000E187177|nr:AAA family ATPase [Campylobacter lari]ECP5279869.1 AAA domain-containing protein [Campylobacter lari]MCV3342034.1 AAA family ATPase [Campylobacter lari]MCV3390027.1 AAA family ATPase [Campylobacter lari]MCV3400968.1 AAA family ATPase [Campylobacter lari]MCV3411754.1 AAA family ATPase [Campylobacter lari]
MSDLKTSLNAIKDKNFGYFFDKDGKCYIYHTKFGKERNSEISGNDNIESKFENLIHNIYNENKDKFNSLKEAFEEYLNDYSNKSTMHIKFDENGEFLKTKSIIVNNFSDTFKEDKFDDEKFKQWWDKSINSARMQGNATNLLKDKTKLADNLKKINDAVSNSSNLTELLAELENVEGMKATARELAYFLQFDKDKFPLANDAMINMVKYIFEMLNKDSKKKLEDIKKETTKTRNEEIYFNFVLDELKINENSYNLPKYYILDQFLNLIDKIKKSDLDLITKDKLQGGDEKYINNITESVYYKLYKAAYDFANLCGKADIKSNDLEGFKKLLKTHKNIIFHGIPGTGKTYTIVNNVKNIIKNENQMLITQFHPSFSYEDFIEGIKPAGIENGQLKLELKNGIFREFCDKAKEEEKGFLEKLEKGNFNEALSDHGYFFIADEINRAELSRVFGELLYALEYRGEKGKIKTQYASMRDDEDFYVPENVFFLGTMNDLDKSIDSFDLALRRRFIWQEMTCDYDVIKNEIYANNIEEYAQACKKLNDKISKDIGEKYQLGHSYFLKIEFKNDEIKDSDMKKLFSNRFEALLKEYLRSEYNEKEIQTHLDNLKKLFVIEKNDDKNK